METRTASAEVASSQVRTDNIFFSFGQLIIVIGAVATSVYGANKYLDTRFEDVNRAATAIENNMKVAEQENKVFETSFLLITNTNYGKIETRLDRLEKKMHKPAEPFLRINKVSK